MPRMGDDNKDRDDNDDGNKGCQGRPLGESTEDGDLQQCTMCYLSGSIFLHKVFGLAAQGGSTRGAWGFQWRRESKPLGTKV